MPYRPTLRIASTGGMQLLEAPMAPGLGTAKVA